MSLVLSLARNASRKTSGFRGRIQRSIHNEDGVGFDPELPSKLGVSERRRSLTSRCSA